MSLPIRSRTTAQGSSSALAELDFYKKKIVIDRHALDICAEEQSQHFLDICDKHTEAISLRDAAKEDLAVIDAELASKQRKSSAEKRMSEGAIYDLVVQDPKHKAAWQRYEDRKHIADRWGNLRFSFEQRAKMIRELTSQFSSGYFTVTTAVRAGNRAAAKTGEDAMHEARSARSR